MKQTEKMNLFNAWRREETAAHIHGWDFSYLAGRYEEETDIPWDYGAEVRRFLQPQDQLLDMDTGGGEFLLSLGHPPENTAATEGYPPNVALCRRTLTPLGIDFRPAEGAGELPFPARRFDLVINRHGDFCPEELFRVLRPGGRFITQQVGAENDRELVELLLPGTPPPFPRQYADQIGQRLTKAGFTLLRQETHYGAIRFYDVGALVWFARVIPWEFPDFSVERCGDALLRAQDLLKQNGVLAGRTHRLLLIAQKPADTH